MLMTRFIIRKIQNQKLDVKWKGPFRVFKIMSKGNVVVV